MHHTQTDTIAVCIVTMQRPVELRRLLAALADVRAPALVKLCFVLVDNDRAGSAGAVVEEMRPFLPGECVYVIEPRPGVSQVRNRAITLASAATWLAFIDDDETPSPDWLVRLHDEATRHGLVAVSGPVRPHFSRPVRAWLLATFELCYVRRKPDQPPSELQTSNLLLDRAYLEAEQLRFDEALGAQGGEDTDLCRQIIARGGQIGWREDAVVIEHVTDRRASLRWLLGRWIRLGGTEVALDRKQMSEWRARRRGLARGVVRIVGGAVGLGASMPRLILGDAVPSVRRMYTVMRGVGMILAALGHVRRDYGAPARAAP